MPWLVISSDSAPEKVALTESATSVGRSRRAMVRIADDKLISGIHLIIYRTAEGFLLRDNNSTNGTKINGKLLLKGRHLLQDGDRITIGKTDIVYREQMPSDGASLKPGKSSLWKRLAALFKRSGD